MLMTTEVTDIGSWQGHWGPTTAIIGRAARGIIACNSRSVVSAEGVMKGRVLFTLKEDESGFCRGLMRGYDEGSDEGFN